MMSLAELQRRIDSGDLSAEAAIAGSFEAIDARDKTIGAFVCRPEKVRAASAGPLRGIAVGIKDIIDTSDLPTEMGSSIYRSWRPRADAPVVMMLKQAGATIIGKTATTALPPLLRGRLDESRDTTPAAYDAACRIAVQARAALADIFDDFDVLLTFSAPGAAPKGLASTGDPRFNRI